MKNASIPQITSANPTVAPLIGMPLAFVLRDPPLASGLCAGARCGDSGDSVEPGVGEPDAGAPVPAVVPDDEPGVAVSLEPSCTWAGAYGAVLPAIESCPRCAPTNALLNSSTTPNTAAMPPAHWIAALHLRILPRAARLSLTPDGSV